MKIKKIISIIIILTLVVVCTILPVFAEIAIYLEIDNVLYQTPGTIQGYKVTDWRILNYSGPQVTWDLEGYYEYSSYASLINYSFTRFRCNTSGRFLFYHDGYHWSTGNESNKLLNTTLEDEWSYPCGTPDALVDAGKVNNAGNLYGNLVYHFFVIEGGDDDDVTDVIDWFVDNDVAMEPMDPDASLEAYRNLKISVAFANRVRPFMFSNIEGYDYRFRLRVSEGADSIHFNTSVEPNEKNFGILAKYIDYSSITTTTQSFTSYQYFHPVTNSSGTVITGQNISLTVYHFDLVFVPNGEYQINWQYLAQEYIYCSYSVNSSYNYVNFFDRQVSRYLDGIIDMPTLSEYYQSCLLKYSLNSTQANTIIDRFNSILPTVSYNVHPDLGDPNQSLSDIVEGYSDTYLLAQNYAGTYFGQGGIFYNIFANTVTWQILLVIVPVIAVGYILYGKRIH